MKSVQVSSLGFKLNSSVPETAAEYDQLAAKDGACVESAVSNTLYRSTLAEFRSNLLHGVKPVGVEGDEGFKPGIAGIEELTGIERKTRGTGKFKGEGESKEEVIVWDETEGDYFKRVCAELVKGGQHASIEAAVASFAAVAQSHLDNVPFDPKETERKEAGPKKIAKVYIDTAQKLIDAGKAESAAAKLSEVLKITVTPDLASLSAAINEDQRRKKLAVAAEYGV